MLLLRLLASAIVIVAAFPALERYCWRPYRCNQIEKAAAKTTERNIEVGGGDTESIRAREITRRLIACMDDKPADVTVYMLTAANERVLGNYEQAIAWYQKALTYDRRPEIYFGIGETYLEMGNMEQAHRYFVATAVFRMDFVKDIPTKMRDEAFAEVIRLQQQPPAGGYAPP
ncbi:MAG TPA: tetratricopeptide repeat protein [Thermoanaerobaculia bacterium]|nr:tetratricopeptide repeat protein [Thermoanaerobaculia bacterium]